MMQTPKLFALLPEEYAVTPDGMAIAPNGDLVLSLPKLCGSFSTRLPSKVRQEQECKKVGGCAGT